MTKTNPYYSDFLKNKVSGLPNRPGVYQYFDKEGKILYIGKAKDLKKRVSSYFNKHYFENNKIRILVKKIHSIKEIVVESESDALLLENNLIKKYQPRYNVNLKDDKTFPWIVIKNEEFPRVFKTRNYFKDGSEYFGPYTNVMVIKELLQLIKQLYPLRTCKHILSDENIKKEKFKVCLEYHIGNCKAPCIGEQNKEDYENSIDKIRKILKGNLQEVIQYLKNLMKEKAETYEFEEAAYIKEKIEAIEKYKSKSTIVNPAINNVDVFSIVDDKNYAFVSYFYINNGAIIHANTIEIQKKLDEDMEELLSYALIEMKGRIKSNANEIIVPFQLNFKFNNYKCIVPQKGDKKKLLDLAERNAKYFKQEKLKRIASAGYDTKVTNLLEKVKKDLHLHETPVYMECFDNSNIQGSNPVAACVVFKMAKPSKKDYRHFKIKTVEGPDDFSSMYEVVKRRYSRLLNEQSDLPQLIIIDGGKGQLNAALKALKELELNEKIAIIGIAKKLEEIYFPDDKYPLYLDKNAETLKLVQKMRNEAHRFGITFHRDQRSKNMTKSELEDISGIGEKTIQELLSNFKSIDEIKSTKISDLEKVIGKQKAKYVFKYFNE